jgi:cysteine desulfurase/selenocysteine lyase
MNTDAVLTTKPSLRLDIERIRRDFPILSRTVHNHPLVYLDNAATSQKPQIVIDTLTHYYQALNANVHRGVHRLSEEATQAFEQARIKVQNFINAPHPSEIIFVRGTTEAINLVAQSYGRPQFKPGDEILLTEMEHHSNIVPWQLLCEQTGAKLSVVPINENGEINLQDVANKINSRTRLVTIVHISNALGTINPIKEIIELAHLQGIPVLIDGAQAVAHLPVDVTALDCDFYAFSSHKLFGPTGIGVLYGKRALLEAMPPYQGGGEMIQTVSFAKTTFSELPNKFEAGTPNIADVIGLGAAIDYISQIDWNAIAHHEEDLLNYATSLALQQPDLRLIGTAKHKAGILSFTLGDIHAHDIGTILDQQGIAIRTGHHCAMPVMQHYNVAATARASFAFYNTKQEIDRLFAGLEKVREVFA